MSPSRPIRLPTDIERSDVDEAYKWRETMRFARDVASRIQTIETSLNRTGVTTEKAIQAVQQRVAPTMAGAAPKVVMLATNMSVAVDSDIVAGHLICRVLDDTTSLGRAYLAKATDSTRFATDICTGVGSYVESLPLATYGLSVFCSRATPTTTGDPRLYVSICPGYATRDLNETGAEYRQQIGLQTGAIGEDGKCQCALSLGPVVLL
jgi:hypothetical protein